MTEETDIAAEMKETKHKTQNTMVAKNKQEFTADNLPPFMKIKKMWKMDQIWQHQDIVALLWDHVLPRDAMIDDQG